MKLIIKNNLKNLEEKYYKNKNYEFIIFSTLSGICSGISNYLDNLIYQEKIFDIFELAQNIDLPGWIIIDLKNKIIYQDQIATLPCFYENLQKTIYIGYPICPYNKIIENEYNIFGYTLSQRFQDLILIAPGSFFNCDKKDLNYWFQFRRSFENSFDLDDFQEIANYTFDKFTNLLNNKKVLIPLSGGFDSRLILDQLIKRNIKLKTYSIGNIRNQDFDMAREISNKLNIDFYQLEVSKKTLSKYIKTDQYKNFWKYSGGDFVLPHFAECLFKKELNFIEKGTIVIPGHSLDFLAGSHIPQIQSESNLNPIELIYNYHCIPKRDYLDAVNIIKKYMKFDKNKLSSVELFDYEYRQSRYIVNHIRNLEFLNFKPVLPLFGFKFINYFMRLKYEDLYARNALLSNYKFSNEILENTKLITAYSKPSKLKTFLKRYYWLRAIVSLFRYFNYSGKDTIYLSLGLHKVIYQILFKGCNHPLSLLRLLRKKT